MKVTDVKTFVVDCFRTNWVFVKVYTDEGITGVGEGTLEYKEKALEMLVEITQKGEEILSITKIENIAGLENLPYTNPIFQKGSFIFVIKISLYMFHQND